MAEQAAHLVDHVLPHVPVRQWVLTLLYPLRYLFASSPIRERPAAIVFAETSTIGLRWTTWRRTVLAREERTVAVG